MGQILDSSAVIAGERKGQSAAGLLAANRASFGPEPIALSTVSAIELEHGIGRAKDAAQAANRQKFFDDLFCHSHLPPDIQHRAPRGQDRWRIQAEGRGDSVPGPGDRG
jgi:predicted nucleic acid-binding protein